MTSKLINGRQIVFSVLQNDWTDKLLTYLENLSEATKSRFGPHPFTHQKINQLIEDTNNYKLYIAFNPVDDSVIAYTIIKIGWIDFDSQRLHSYQLTPEPGDCTLAPSVADSWQSQGIGSAFLYHVIHDLKSNHQIKRIILWGGVQGNNIKAIKLYKKFGFLTLGEFEHNGMNLDMLLDL